MANIPHAQKKEDDWHVLARKTWESAQVHVIYYILLFLVSFIRNVFLWLGLVSDGSSNGKTGIGRGDGGSSNGTTGLERGDSVGTKHQN